MDGPLHAAIRRIGHQSREIMIWPKRRCLGPGPQGQKYLRRRGTLEPITMGVTTRIPQAIDQSCSHHRRGEQDDPPRPAGRHTCLDPAGCNHAQHAGGRKAAVAIPRRFDISLRNPEATEFFDILNRLSDIGIKDVSIETF